MFADNGILFDRDGGCQHGRMEIMPVHITSTIRTFYGSLRLAARSLIEVSLTAAELHAVVRWLEREAAAALNDNHDGAADLLFNRAAAFREAAR
jgi:hypothetical protein